MSKQEIPVYGPLTFDDWDRLASSFYDESRYDERDIAEARGIRSGESIGVYIQLAREGIDPIVDPYHRSKSFTESFSKRSKENV